MKPTKHIDERKQLAPLCGLGLAAVGSAVLFAALPVAAIAQDTAAPSAMHASISDATIVPGALSSITRAASSSKMLHVIVGHSIFVDTKSRLRKVYVADPAVLNSVCLTPTEIIVTAMTPGISSLTLLDEAGQAQSYVVSSDIDIEGLRTAMNQEMRGDAVKVDGSGGRITLSGIVGSDAAADAAVKLAGLYSKEVSNALTVTPTHPKQVRLQVRILEVDRSKALQLGINLFNPGGNTSFLAGATTSQYPSTMAYSQGTAGNIGGGSLATTNPLNFMLYSAKLNLGATIQDLQTKQVLQILAEPTITTISGEKADFLSGGEFPFPVVQASSGTNSAPIVTISFRPYGVKVEFTPIVNEDGTIRLKVAPEVSALDYTNSVTISGFTVPALSTRRASTEVELRSDQSFAISGLLDQRTTDILNKDPGAASIPILGYLFKSKNQNHSTTELIIVVTPTVVDPLVETAKPSQPELPIAPLDIPAYDKSLKKDHNPQPEAPPITPDDPPSVPPVFHDSATVTLPTLPASPHSGRTQSQQQVTLPDPPSFASTIPPNQPPGSTSRQTAPIRIATPAAVSGSGAPLAAIPAQPAQQNRISPSSMVEVMALSHEADAEAMVAALNRRGYNVTVNRDTQSSLLHLDLGPFANRKDAESMRQRLLLDGYDAMVK